MNKIKCVECGEVLESGLKGVVDSCSCLNHAFVVGGDSLLQIGANDITKITVWNDATQVFEKTVM